MNVVNSVQEQDICNLFIAKLISPDFYFPLSTFHESKITKHRKNQPFSLKQPYAILFQAVTFEFTENWREEIIFSCLFGKNVQFNFDKLSSQNGIGR